MFREDEESSTCPGECKGGASACDDVLSQFDEFISVTVASNNSTFASFDPNEANARVDELLHKFMANNQQYRSVWRVVSDLLLLSHGQASVERGFSVNRQIKVENLHEESVVAQRLVCDHINNAGGIHKVDISKQLLISAASARQKYMAHLDERKRAKITEEVARKRKDVLEEIDELKRKKKCLESDIVELNESADEYAQKSEDTGKLNFVVKSNSLRRTAKEKTQQLTDLSAKLDDAVKKMKH